MDNKVYIVRWFGPEHDPVGVYSALEKAKATCPRVDWIDVPIHCVLNSRVAYGMDSRNISAKGTSEETNYTHYIEQFYLDDLYESGISIYKVFEPTKANEPTD
jgi:hypothetical protein